MECGIQSLQCAHVSCLTSDFCCLATQGLNVVCSRSLHTVFIHTYIHICICHQYVLDFLLNFSSGITCPDLENPANGAVTVNGMNPGDTATYTCISGYELEGAATLTCGSNGMWSPEPPVCTRELSHK